MAIKNQVKAMMPSFILKIVQARKIPSICFGAFSSYVGVWVALRHAVGLEPELWERDFMRRRVLVIGTGPSLDHVNGDYFANFDVLICINHAILRVPRHPCVYYLSTDVPRTREVLNTEAAERIRALAPERRILFLSFVLAAPYLLSNFFKFFTVVRYREYELHKWGEKQLSQRYYQPKVASDLEIESWINGGSNIQSMPSRGGSSAFSAVLLAARYHPAEIRLIGVDLNAGRSTALQKIAGPAAFGGDWARDRFQHVERLVKQCGINIENDSWILAPKE